MLHGCKIILKIFQPGTEQLFENMMQLQNSLQNFWYTFQWQNYVPATNPYPRLQSDSTPNWVLNWWHFYGVSPWQLPMQTLRETFRCSSIYSRARSAVLSIPSEELTWWNLYNVREMTWINTLRTHNRYPTIRWIYRPRVFFRFAHIPKFVFLAGEHLRYVDHSD